MGVQFTVPEREQKIWRYLDFVKLYEFILSKKLFFSRSDKLGDPFEGSRSLSDQIASKMKQAIINRESLNSRVQKLLRNWIFINCWHINDNESEAMWKIYGDNIGNNSVALQTTVGKCLDALGKCEYKIHFGQVEYRKTGASGDLLTTDSFDESDPFSFESRLEYFFNKQFSFEYENEFRAIIFQIPEERNEKIELMLKEDWPKGESADIDTVNRFERLFDNNEIGIKVPVGKINEFIDILYVSPNSDDWYHKLVKQMVSKHKIKVVRKELNPIWC